MILTVIGAILIFSVIIFVHELGHFLAAKAFGVNVLEFAIGMGPAIYKKQGNDTLYSVRAIPMGGYCKMEGEDEEIDSEGSFSSKKPLPKIIILAAGAIMNIVLGFIIATVIVTVTSFQSGFLPSTVVESVNSGASASQFLKAGDRITEVNGTKINIRRDISFALSQAEGEDCTLSYVRDGKTHTATFTPMEIEYDDGTTGRIIGFDIAPAEISFWGILRESFFETIWMFKLVFVSLGMLISGEAGMSDVSGPVGVVSAMNEAAQSGMLNFLFLVSFLAVNIGIMNLLPLPALDGGRIVFALFELIFRKPVPPEKEGVVHAIGLIFLFGLMIFATWNDILRLIGG